MSINGPQMTLRHDHCHDKVWECAWSGLLYMGLARVIRAGWAPRNHCWVTGCLTTSLKCGTDHYSVWPTARYRNSSTSTTHQEQALCMAYQKVTKQELMYKY